MSLKKGLRERIESREAVCAVIGLGYVGLPLAVELAVAGFRVFGIDTDESKVEKVRSGVSYIPDVADEALRGAVEGGKLGATADYSVISGCDTVNICVPTPLNKTRDPDISFIIEALEKGVAPNLHKDMLIVLESTTYPGTTEEVVVPVVVESGLEPGKDIFVAFSPERVDPGNPRYRTKNIPRVVGGVTAACTGMAEAFYGQFLENVHVVSSAAVAEMVKIHENTFRSVNIALVNELTLMCDRLGIDVWEVIEGASTKPFGFMPFYPGPGLGGHCIPIDPYYLSWKARSVGFEARFIELAGQVNGHMPVHVVRKAADALNSVGRAVRGAKILIAGVAYKKNIDDVRESPALDIMELLLEMGADISYTDPYVPDLEVGTAGFRSREFSEDLLEESDLVIIVTDHNDFDCKLILDSAGLILDTRNAIRERVEKVWRI